MFCSSPCLFNCPWPGGNPPGKHATTAVYWLFVILEHTCTLGTNTTKGYQDSIDPNSPLPPKPTGNPDDPDDPDDECETRTYDACREVCYESPTSRCTATCSEVESCISTSQFPSTVTLAPAVANTNARPNPPVSDRPYAETVSSASSVIMYLSSIGDWDFGEMDPTSSSTTRRPSQTVTYSYPTGTSVNDIEAECYKDYDEMENAAKFARDMSFDVVSDFCAAQYRLRPSDDWIWQRVLAGPYYVWAIMGWADDQSGCGTKETQTPSGDTQDSYLGCINSLGLVMQDCEGLDYDGNDSVYAGGGWVLNSGSGCVLIMHFATTETELTIPIGPKPRVLSATSADNITDMWHFESDDLRSWRVPLDWNTTMPTELRSSANMLARGWRGVSEP